MSGDTLIVDVHADGKVLTLSTPIYYPKEGVGPFPLMIGASHNSIPAELFTSRNIAMMVYYEKQVNSYSQFGQPAGRGNYPFDRLYPSLISNGAYSEWAWGFSRLLDGLQKLGPEVTRIDMKHIGVTGCSYAGKMALFCGALDERVALTIAQEPGGGGAASWRVSNTLGNVETLDKTDYNWFLESMRQRYGGDDVAALPHDHHELVAICCPRALLLLGNPDYEWLADPSMYVSANAAIKVWERFGSYTLLELHLETGRTHQIRVHLAYKKHPLLGDTVYGGADPYHLEGQALHGYKLELTHPRTGEPLKFTVPMPPELMQVLKKLQWTGAAPVGAC